MGELYHAFYSKRHATIKSNLKKTQDFKYISITNVYKLHNSNKKVITTAVYPINKYPNSIDGDFRYRDAIYLGIVDIWMSYGY